jgi:hypothetical protein
LDITLGSGTVEINLAILGIDFCVLCLYLNHLRSNDETSWNINVFTTYALRWILGDLNILLSPTKYFERIMTVTAQGYKYICCFPHIICIFNIGVWYGIILSKYLVGLNNRIFLFRDLSWSSYKDEVLFQHFTWEKLVYGRPSCTLFRFRVVIMTTLDHTVEEGCIRILLEAHIICIFNIGVWYGWNQLSNTWYRFLCIMFIFKSPRIHLRAYVVNTFMFQLVNTSSS